MYILIYFHLTVGSDKNLDNENDGKCKSFIVFFIQQNPAGQDGIKGKGQEKKKAAPSPAVRRKSKASTVSAVSEIEKVSGKFTFKL